MGGGPRTPNCPNSMNHSPSLVTKERTFGEWAGYEQEEREGEPIITIHRVGNKGPETQRN